MVIFTSRAQPWYAINPHLPKFPEIPTPLYKHSSLELTQQGRHHLSQAKARIPLPLLQYFEPRLRALDILFLRAPADANAADDFPLQREG